MRRPFTAGLWLATTVAATALVWTATSVVASDVTDRPAPVVAHRDVVMALASGSSVVPTTTVPAPTLTAAAATVPHPATPKVPATPAPSQASPPTTRPVAAGGAPLGFLPVGPPASVAQPRSNPTVPLPTTSTTQAAPVTGTYSTRGGVVTVVCTGPSSIRLVSASPSDGYRIDHNVDPGPNQVEVHFVKDDDVSVKAACYFGQPFRLDNQGHRTAD